MMPDVLPSLLGCRVEIHILKVKKSPGSLRKLTEDFGKYLEKYLRKNTTP
jgi:hypothetical protein